MGIEQKLSLRKRLNNGVFRKVFKYSPPVADLLTSDLNVYNAKHALVSLVAGVPFLFACDSGGGNGCDGQIDEGCKS